MNEEIGGINRTLSDTPGAFVDGVNLGGNKTRAVQRWFRSVIGRLENYKAEHKMLVKEAMVLLELALWKATLEENGSSMDAESNSIVRIKHRVTCGADIVIKNVLPFLVLKEYREDYPRHGREYYA